jgi:hypothetical protein
LTVPVADLDAPLGEQLFDITVAEGEAVVQPDRVSDDLGRETVASERRNRCGAGGHGADPTLPITSTCQCIASTYCANASCWPTDTNAPRWVPDGPCFSRQACGTVHWQGEVNKASRTSENEQRRAARKRYQAQYRALMTSCSRSCSNSTRLGSTRTLLRSSSPKRRPSWHACGRPD